MLQSPVIQGRWNTTLRHPPPHPNLLFLARLPLMEYPLGRGYPRNQHTDPALYELTVPEEV